MDGDTQAALGFYDGAELDGQSLCYVNPSESVQFRHRTLADNVLAYTPLAALSQVRLLGLGMQGCISRHERAENPEHVPHALTLDTTNIVCHNDCNSARHAEPRDVW